MEKVIKRWQTAWQGVKITARDWRFWLVGVISSLIFIFIFNLLSAGNNFLQLLIALPWLDKLFIVGQVYQEFLVHLLSLEKLLILLAAAGQGLIVGMIVYLWRARRQLDDTALLESAGASLVALVGAGCPLCGGTILLPLLMSIFGASAMTFLQGVSLFLMAAALVPIAFAIRRLGFLCSMKPRTHSVITRASARSNPEVITGLPRSARSDGKSTRKDKYGTA